MYHRIWKIVLTVVSCVVIFCHSYVFASTIGNIRCIVTPSETIMIHYHLAGKGTFTVTVKVSLDGGKNFTITPQGLSGDVGTGIGVGESKRIEWDVFQDVNRLSGNMVVMLEAVSEPGKPINKWYVLAGVLFAGGAIAAMGGGSGGKSAMVNPPAVVTYGFIKVEIEFPE